MKSEAKKQDRTSCFLAFFDILGFGQLVTSGNIDIITELYKNYIDNEIATLNDKEFNTEALNLIPLKFLVVSDSILIYTQQDTHSAIRKLTYVARHFFLRSLFKGLPLRGAITHGELRFVDGTSLEPNLTSNVVIGAPIVNAFKLEKLFDWAGCVLHPDCEKKILELRDGPSQLFSNNILTRYKAPKKSGDVEDLLVLNWANMEFPRTAPIEMLLETAFGMHGKKTNDWAVRNKILNTARFYEWWQSGKRERFFNRDSETSDKENKF